MNRFGLQRAGSIKRLANIRWLRWITVGILILSMLIGCQLRKGDMPDFDEQANLSGNQQQVVLLHGMWRNSAAMEKIETFFAGNGYQVHSLSYPSNDYDVETLVERYLDPQIQTIRAQSSGKIHFVTHSMGGILVRYYLKNYQVPELGRVVMIAPPNHGSELTELFEGADWFDNLTGPAGQQLNTDEDSWVNLLGQVDFELGVVAGNYNSNLITSWLLPGPDDGVVTTKNAEVEGMKDFLLVPEKHYRLRSAKVVMQQAAYFLKYGSFYQSGDDG